MPKPLKVQEIFRNMPWHPYAIRKAAGEKTHVPHCFRDTYGSKTKLTVRYKFWSPLWNVDPEIVAESGFPAPSEERRVEMTNELRIALEAEGYHIRDIFLGRYETLIYETIPIAPLTRTGMCYISCIPQAETI